MARLEKQNICNVQGLFTQLWPDCACAFNDPLECAGCTSGISWWSFLQHMSQAALFAWNVSTGKQFSGKVLSCNHMAVSVRAIAGHREPACLNIPALIVHKLTLSGCG